MAVLSILSVPDPCLRQIALPIEVVTDEIRQLMDDMVETMLYKDRGIGLAANQVGVLQRVIVGCANLDSKRDVFHMANPEVIWSSDDSFMLTEGCLSVPEAWAEVKRPKTIRVRYLDYHNTLQERELKDDISSVVQHEIDHLNGKLFIDHLTPTRKRLLLDRALKAHRRPKGIRNL